MKNKFLIIGSGASAIGLIYGLLDRDKRATIEVVTSERFNGVIRGPDKRTPMLIPEKSKDGKLPKKYQTDDKKLRLYDSENHSMSLFWGAGMYVAPDYCHLIGAGQDQINSLVSRLPIMGIEDDINLQYTHPWKTKPKTHFVCDKEFASGAARLAISNTCVRCNKCMSGCDIDAIWSSTTEISSLLSRDDISLRFGKVFKIENSSVYYLDETNSTEILSTNDYEKVYLCAGVIGTSKILLNSNFGISEVIFKDNPVITIPAFTKLKNNTGITLANEFIIANSSSAPQLISVYPFFPEIWMTKVFKILKRLPFLQKFVEENLIFLRMYTTADNPQEIRMINCGGSIKFERLRWKIASQDKSLLRRLKKKLAKNFTFVFPIKILNPTSAHYYGAKYHGVSSSDFLKSIAANNLTVADASTIDEMPAISPTFSIMITAYMKGFRVG